MYLSGDTALLTCSVDNMKSSSAFKVKAQLVQTVTIYSENTNPFIYRNVIHEEDLPVFRRKQVSTFVINFPLKAKKAKTPL